MSGVPSLDSILKHGKVRCMNPTLTSAPNITTVRKGKRIGVNRDDVAVGYAVRTNLKSQPEHWTAYVYIADPPFDVARVGFKSADEVVAFIGKHGTPKEF